MSENSGSNKSTPSSSTAEPIWLGIGSPRPQPRVKQNSMFGHVVDAFDEKSIIKIGEVTPYEKRMKAEQEKQKATEAAATPEVQKKDEESTTSTPTTASEIESMAEETGKIEEVATVAETSSVEKIISESTASSRLLIKGGKIINDDQTFEADVYIEDEQIKIVEANIQVLPDTKVINAAGKLVMPGGIDTSTHFQAPFIGTLSVDDFFHGTKAALSGGTTMIVDCVQPEKGQSLLDAFEKWRQRADDKVCCDYSLRVSLPTWNEKIAQDMETLVKEKGVNTFAISVGFDDADDTVLYNIFKHCRQLGAVAQIRADNLSICKQKAKEIFDDGISGPEGHVFSRPEEVEAEAVNRSIALGSQAGAPILVTNITSKSAAEVIEKSRRKGKCVFGEPLLASLAVNGSHYFNKCWRHAAGYVTSPPLRTWPNTITYLNNLLANGDLQTVASDHQTFNAEQKALGKDDFRKIPPGVNGVAERMSIVWGNGVIDGKMDLCRFVAVTSTNAAKMLNLYPKKGRIAAGSDADIVIWDPEEAQTFSTKSQLSRCDFNIFEDMTFQGVAKYVISRGRVVLDEDGVNATEGSGQFVSNPCNPEFLYNKIWVKERAQQFQPVHREPYQGPVPGDGSKPGNVGGSHDAKHPCTAPSVPGEMYSRPPTRSGGRNMQDSTFSLGGVGKTNQPEDPITAKKGGGYRVNQPPGGQSTQLW